MRAIVRLSVGLVGLLTLGSGTLVLAQLIPPAGPASPASAKFTLGDVFLRLTTGATGVRRAGAFTEPAPGPIGATMYTTDQVMAAAPAVDDTGGAVVGDVLAGDWGLRSGAWGQLTGTLATQVLSASSTAVSAGYYASTDLATVDPDLATGSIRSGVAIFGVTGSPYVVDTAGATATAGDVLSAKTGYANGALVTGSMPTQELSASSAAVPAGYYAATTLSAVDSDLAAGNIRAGVTVFGVSGDPNVVNTGTGTAVAASILLGKKAWVTGTEITGTGYPAAVPRTGQTTSYAGGDDGALQSGVAWPNPRFTDNANGTVTDNLTGLVWLKDASCFWTGVWASAIGNARSLASGQCGLADSSTAGQWRVPSRAELESLLDIQFLNPSISNSAGTGQWTGGDPFTNIQSGYRWTSSTVAWSTADAWVVQVHPGTVSNVVKTYSLCYVWPVRDRQ